MPRGRKEKEISEQIPLKTHTFTIYLLQLKTFLVNVNWTDSIVCDVNLKLYTASNSANKFCEYKLILTFGGNSDINWHKYPPKQFSYWYKCHFSN